VKTCSDVMTKGLACCTPDDSTAKAAQLMKDEDVGAIPVVRREDHKELLGIVTDRDLALSVVAEARDPKKTKVDEVMSRDPVSCLPEDAVEKAIDAMAERQIRRVPVVDSQGYLVGIIAQGDLATRLANPEMVGEVVGEISRPVGTATL
jgi:CBS domain-containing protein